MTPKPHYLLVYGSQTGQSEAISESIALQSPDQDLDVTLRCAQDVDISLIYKPSQVVVFVVSSTGEGDPPDNFEQFWTKLREKGVPLSALHYAVLGLGDTNYTSFGGFPEQLNTFLSESGAKRFYKFEIADDAVGLEIVVEPWIEGLWDPLKECLHNIHNLSVLQEHDMLQKIENLSLSDTSTTKMFYELKFGNEDYPGVFPHGVKDFILPFADGKLEECSIVSTSRLSAVDERVKECLEFEVTTSETYEAGDSFGLLCENSDEDVLKILDILELTDKSHVQYSLTADKSIKPRLLPKHVLSQCSPYYSLKYTLDIHSLPKKAFLKYLSECCTDPTEIKYLCYLSSKDGSTAINELVYKNNLTLLDLLNLFPSCKPGLAGLLQFLPRLMPRYYSVSRIMQAESTDRSEDVELSGRSIKFVLNVVEDIRPGCDSKLPLIQGVCTSWLQRVRHGMSSSTGPTATCHPAPVLHVYKRKNAHFRPVTNKSMIMIGAGTGVAPFLSFLDHLSVNKSGKTVVLITGNRYKDLDSIYSSEFGKYKDSGVLSEHYTVYSRDRGYTSGSYVQDMLCTHAKHFVNLIDEGAVVYVCGDAKGLAVGVFGTFKKILSDSKDISEKDAEGLLQDMKQNKRYLEDIWA